MTLFDVRQTMFITAGNTGIGFQSVYEDSNSALRENDRTERAHQYPKEPDYLRMQSSIHHTYLQISTPGSSLAYFGWSVYGGETGRS